MEQTFKLVIDVTQDDLARGKYCNAQSCAVAYAVNRTLKQTGIGKPSYACVFSTISVGAKDSERETIQTPVKLFKLITQFDSHGRGVGGAPRPERFVTEWPMKARDLFKDEYVIGPDQDPFCSPAETVPVGSECSKGDRNV